MREESAAAIKNFSLEIDFLLTRYTGSKRKRKKVAPKKKKKTDRAMLSGPVGLQARQGGSPAEDVVDHFAVGRVNLSLVKVNVNVGDGVSSMPQCSGYGVFRYVQGSGCGCP